MKSRFTSVTLWAFFLAVSFGLLRVTEIVSSVRGATSLLCLAQEDSVMNTALLPESWAREAATIKVVPTYPVEAIQHGISGIVHIKFKTSAEGEVTHIKVRPRTEPLLAAAVVEVFRGWTFKPRSGQDGMHKPVISRMIFSFVLGTSEPRVRLYDPGPHPPDVQNLGYYNSAKEMREWREWPQVPPEPSKP
jgi:TonB family protein